MNSSVRPQIIFLAAFVVLTLAALLYVRKKQQEEDCAETERYKKYQETVLNNLHIVDDFREVAPSQNGNEEKK